MTVSVLRPLFAQLSRRRLWAQTRGHAPSLNAAIEGFANIAGAIANVIAVGVNAAPGELEVEVAYESTPGATDREFFQQALPLQIGLPRETRRVDVQACSKFLEKIATHPEIERLFRGIGQYIQALDNCRLGKETLALTHLWMGMEALTPVVRRKLIRKMGIHAKTTEENNKQLAISLDVELKKLDATIRKKHLFNGDEECYKTAKNASDGFEHAFKNFDQVQVLSRQVRSSTAAYLQSAIFDIAGVEADTRHILLGEPYNNPMGNWPLVTYFRGRLIGNSDNLAAPGLEYPTVALPQTIKDVTFSPSEGYNYEIEHNVQALIAEGISLLVLLILIFLRVYGLV